ncbi:MAG: molybdenum ABC transporter ATP-binding protein [Sandaracinus sp.]|nr:molybdenum ABC transporter ATP-binding protein [Sandaracinus sp.]|tara:strand:- start:6241 stop:6915 length:675 start_codon:yes stop_codon:yes gene_type:complete
MSDWAATVRARVGTFLLDVALEGRGTVALVGPNGSGKTTLLRALLGAIPAEAATFTLAGRALAELSVEERRIGYVPQGSGLFPHLDVLGNVTFGRPGAAAAAVELLDELGCGHLRSRRVYDLSGGERQRVALARALLAQPDMLLLDEPLAALDAITRRQVRALLRDRLAAFGRPVVLVTHDVRDIEALAERVWVLEKGSVVQQGTLAELRAAPADVFVTELVAD